jgi:hypothetical protein
VAPPPAPCSLHALQGLNLLRLLVQNRIAEFHTELELISPEARAGACVGPRRSYLIAQPWAAAAGTCESQASRARAIDAPLLVAVRRRSKTRRSRGLSSWSSGSWRGRTTRYSPYLGFMAAMKSIGVAFMFRTAHGRQRSALAHHAGRTRRSCLAAYLARRQAHVCSPSRMRATPA